MLLKLPGWTATAPAGTMGAGCWFGLLAKAVNIRGSAVKLDAAEAAVPA